MKNRASFGETFVKVKATKTGALYFVQTVIDLKQNQRVGYESLPERPSCATFSRKFKRLRFLNKIAEKLKKKFSNQAFLNKIYFKDPLPFVRNKGPRFLRMLPKCMLKTQVSTNKKKNSEVQEGLEIEHPACGLVKIVQS